MQDAPHPNGPAFAEPFETDVLEVSDADYYGEGAATLGDRIAAARQAAGLSKSGLAAKLGVSVKVVGSWEIDRSEPRANRLAMLAGLLGVSVSWLLTGGGDGVAPPDAEAPAEPRALAVSYAFAVEDLEAARRFYGDAIGAVLTGSGPEFQEFELFGHQLRAEKRETPGAAGGRIGMALHWDAWLTLIERLRAEGVVFAEEPNIQAVGAPEETGTFRVEDPSGNALDFSARRDVGGTAGAAA